MDNYDTQHMEHLHIELTKDAYWATNTRDELPQMIKWLERQEQVHCHGNFISQEMHNCTHRATSIAPIPELHPKRGIKMTVKPSVWGVSIAALASNYGAHDFCDAFARFTIEHHQPGIQRAELEHEISCFVIPFTTVSIYHRIKYEDVEAQAKGGSAVDAIYVQAQHHGKNGRIIAGQFDTALVYCGTDRHDTGVHGMYTMTHTVEMSDLFILAHCVVQVRVVFSISPTAMNKLFGTPMSSATKSTGSKNITTKYWAYVEWFSQFRPNLEADSQLYRVSQLRQSTGQPVASIIPVSDLRQSIHLFPLFGSTIPREWTSGTSLSNASTFLVNSFTDVPTYLLFNPLL